MTIDVKQEEGGGKGAKPIASTKLERISRLPMNSNRTVHWSHLALDNSGDTSIIVVTAFYFLSSPPLLPPPSPTPPLINNRSPPMHPAPLPSLSLGKGLRITPPPSSNVSLIPMASSWKVFKMLGAHRGSLDIAPSAR